MIANPMTRKLAGWRINPLTISRVKEAAKRENISANDFVERVLDEATKHIETKEEREERLLHNKSFLDRFAGAWKGSESSEEIMDSIKSANSSKEIITL